MKGDGAGARVAGAVVGEGGAGHSESRRSGGSSRFFDVYLDELFAQYLTARRPGQDRRPFGNGESGAP